MDYLQRRRRNRRHAPLSRVCLVVGIVAGGLLSACRSTATPEPDATPRPPSVQFLQPPPTLCRDATQLRLDVQVTGPRVREAEASWRLYRANKDEPLSQGAWSGGSGEIYVPFPDGTPLPPGDYKVSIDWHGESLTRQRFTIQPESPSIEGLGITLIPDGELQVRLTPEVRHFYVRITYDGACPGAPYWLTVNQGSEVVCRQNGGLDREAGTASIPCYQDRGRAFAEGTYEATVTLMDDVQRTEIFEIAAPAPTSTPLPTATPRPSPFTCGPLFSAAGLTPEGEPFLPLTLFDWYTQAIYVGTQCDRLTPGTAWQSTWYRDGELAGTHNGLWMGEPEGVIWDSLTGVPGSPFLRPGTYTITLRIEATEPLTTEVRVLAYPSADQE